MATLPTGAVMTAMRCRELHQRTARLRSSESIPISPVTSPECTPPASPRKTELPHNVMSQTNPLAKLSQLLHRSMSNQAGEVGASASGQTQSLEASHHTSSITSMT